jgi:hypothetical protein
MCGLYERWALPRHVCQDIKACAEDKFAVDDSDSQVPFFALPFYPDPDYPMDSYVS